MKIPLLLSLRSFLVPLFFVFFILASWQVLPCHASPGDHTAFPPPKLAPPTPQPKKLSKTKKIALLHMHDGAWFFQKLGSITLNNKVRYAKKHGYEIVFHTPSGTKGLWEQVDIDSHAGNIQSVQKKHETCPDSNKAECEDDNQKSTIEDLGDQVPSSQAKDQTKSSTNLPCPEKAIQRADGGCYRENNAFQIDPRAATFGKIKLAQAACVGRKNWWLLWADADAMIVNQSIPLHQIIDDAYDIHITADWLMINAGVILFKCSTWTKNFLTTVYNAREFDTASALDQSAFQHHFDTVPGAAKHIRYLPKYALNVYTEEYRPGDFLLHMAGKLYEASEKGAVNLALQFDALSMIDSFEHVSSFFVDTVLLNAYSSTCYVKPGDAVRDCKTDDPRRLRLPETLLSFSSPNRYKHVAVRYHWMKDWKDKYDIKGWDTLKKPLFNDSNKRKTPKSSKKSESMEKYEL